MVASQLIENKIAGMKPTKIFTIRDLDFPMDWWENVRVKLGRMVKSGLIEKVGKGKYYKPQLSAFGNIGPSPDEMVKDLMYDNGALSGYLTGYTVWNRMGLTSQISNVIIIGTSRRRDALRRGNYEIRFMTQPNRVTSGSIPLLQILDSLKQIKQIPDTTIDQSVRILRKHIANLDARRLPTLVKLARKYPPRVRALLGAILESIGNNDYIGELKQSLNPMSSYEMGLSNLPEMNLKNWGIR